jgi:hypothetical protein
LTLRFGSLRLSFDRQPVTRRFGACRGGACTRKVDAAPSQSRFRSLGARSLQ